MHKYYGQSKSTEPRTSRQVRRMQPLRAPYLDDLRRAAARREDRLSRQYSPRARQRKMSLGHILKRDLSYKTKSMSGMQGYRRKRPRRRAKSQYAQLRALKKRVKMLMPQPTTIMYEETFAPTLSALGQCQWFSTISQSTFQRARLFQAVDNDDNGTFFVKDMQKLHITSAVETPQHIEVYKCVLRNNLAEDLNHFDLAQLRDGIDRGYGAEATNSHLRIPSSLFRNKQFCQMVKIKNVKKYYLEPTKSIYLSLYSQRKWSGALVMEGEAAYTGYKSAEFYVFKIWGVPVMDTVEDTRVVSTAQSGINIVVTGKILSYESADSVSTVILNTSGFGAVADAHIIGHKEHEVDQVVNTVP